MTGGREGSPLEVVGYVRGPGVEPYTILQEAPNLIGYGGGSWYVRTPGGDLLGPRDKRDDAVALACRESDREPRG